MLGRRNRSRIASAAKYFQSGWRPYAALAAVLVYSASLGLSALYDVVLPYTPSFVGSAASTDGIFVSMARLWISRPSEPLPMLIWPPGFILFYGAIFKATGLFGVEPTSTLYSEISYRIVQLVIALGSVAAWCLFLNRHAMRDTRYGLILIVLPALVLAVDPELILAYLRPTYHGMFIPLFILLSILGYRIAFIDQGLKTAILLGVIGAIGVLWRDELRFALGIALMLAVVGSGFSWKVIKAAGFAAIVSLLLILPVQYVGYLNHGLFALHLPSHVAMALIDYLAYGNFDNPYGIANDDCLAQRFLHLLDLSPIGNEDRHETTAWLFFLKHVVSYPMDQVLSWLRRTPSNIFILASDHSHPSAMDAVKGFIGGSHTQFIWVLLVVNLILLPFAFLRHHRILMFALFPGVYALGIVGNVATGPGYFIYCFVTLATIPALGLVAVIEMAPRLLHPARTWDRSTLRGWSGAIAALMGLVWAVTMISGVYHYEPRNKRVQYATNYVLEARSKRLADERQKPNPAQIIWLRNFPSGTFPYAPGHLIVTPHGVVFSTDKHLTVVDPEDGQDKFVIPRHDGPGCPARYFEVRGDTVLLADLAPDGKQELRTASLSSRQVGEAVPFARHIYNSFISDDHALYYASYVQPRPNFQPQRLITVHRKGGAGASADSGYDWVLVDVLSMSGLAQNGDTVFFGTMSNGRFLAIDKKTGAIRWEFAGAGRTFAAPIIVGGRVVYGDNSGTLYALDEGTGRELWKTRVGSIVVDGIWSDGDAVYVGTFDGSIVSLNVSDGAVRWRAEGEGAVQTITGMDDGTVIVGTGNWVYKLKRQNGSIIWRVYAGGYVRDVIADNHGAIFVRTSDSIFKIAE